MPARQLLVLLAITAAAAAAEPRIAVWDPQSGTRETRFVIDRPLHDRTAATLQAAGMAVTRVDAAQLAALDAQAVDAVMLAGDAVPRAAIPGLQRFADQGGVLVALAAMLPFVVAIEPEKVGAGWTMSPKEPKFAWQTEALLGHFGAKYVYNPGMHDLGSRHTATELFKRYLPEAPDLPPGRLPSRFLPPGGEAGYWPLIRSQRGDGHDTTPQLYVMQLGRRRAIVSGSAVYTSAADPARWALGERTVVALARLAKDLHDGLQLDPAGKIDFGERTVPPAPLTSRMPRGSGVDPEGATPLVRWGRFDGSCTELGGDLSGSVRQLAISMPAGEVPRSLASAGLELPVPAAPSHRYLRIRGAYAASGAVLRVTAGKQVLWNERLSYIDAGGVGNFEAADLKDVAHEFTRVVFVPPGIDGLVLANPAETPFSIDAFQLETHPRPMPEFNIGCNGNADTPAALARTWGGIRLGIKFTMVGPPDDPRRWEAFDAQMERSLAVGCPIHFILEGTPAWAAITPERYQAEVAKKGAGRPWCVPPDPAKYAEITARVAGRYGDRIAAWELWNEANSGQFYKGTPQEYAALCRALIDAVRSQRKDARFISTGMAGFHLPTFRALVDGGVMPDITWVANHVYAGKSPGWDIAFGVGQGDAMADGFDPQWHLNEQGFVWANEQWFTAPPVYTPWHQQVLLDQGTARLLADGATRLSFFHAQGRTDRRDRFGLVADDGTPRPAYAVVADYAALSGCRRLDADLVGGDGGTLAGVHLAAGMREDGSVTLVVNPAEVPAFIPPAPEILPLASFATLGGWRGFQGRFEARDGRAVLSVGKDKLYAGFGHPVHASVGRYPTLEVDVPVCARMFQLSLSTGGRQVVLLKDKPAGTYRLDLKSLVGEDEMDGELTFRVFGDTEIAAVRFIPDPAAAAVSAPPPIAVRVTFPCPGRRPLVGSARCAGVSIPVAAAIQGDGDIAWAVVDLRIVGRTVVDLAPR